MANQAAFQAGWDAADNKAAAKKTQKATSTLAKAKVKPVGIGTMSPTDVDSVRIPMAKHGGRVTKTGLIYAHRGETITPKGRMRKGGSRKRSQIKA